MDEAAASTAIQTASALDAAGRYADSMDVLKQASLRGDLAAMTELAHRLLTGDRVPKSPKHALYLLRQAAAEVTIPISLLRTC